MVYVGTHNNMKKMSASAVVLKASNEEGGYFFMYLYSGERIHSYIQEELHIDQDVIDGMEQLAKEEKQPVMDNNQALFKWLSGKDIKDLQH